jgi:hypothetical protein
MPLLEAVPQFLRAEYERFQEGVSQLNQGERAAATGQAMNQLRRPGEAPSISIPGWDDVVHLTPKLPLDYDRVRQHYAGLRRGEPGILTEAETIELDRRRGVRDRMRTSVQPEYSKAFGQILTALDNVQDFLTTVSVAGRLVLWPASKIAGRAIPGVGWVILGADLLNLLSFVGQLAMPAYALACYGPKQALAAGIPAAIFGRALKSETWKLAHLNPFSRQARAARKLRAARVIPGFGAVLEVLQTTDQLLGVGVSLGGLVGGIMESAYAIEAKTRGVDVKVNLPGSGERTRAYIQGQLEQRPAADVRTRQQAAGVLYQAPQVLRTQDVFTEEEHIAVLGAYLAALDLLSDDLAVIPWEELITDLLDQDLAPGGTADPATVELLAEIGEGTDSVDRWAFPEAPARVSGRAYLAFGAREIPAALDDFLRPRRNSRLGAFYGCLVGNVHDRLWRELEGDGDVFKQELTPEWRLLSSLTESNRLVNVGEPEEAILRFWQLGQAKLDQTNGRYLVAEELDALAAEAGLTLIRLVAPHV